MCSQSLPKEFEKTTEVLPFSKCGVSTIEEFKEEQEAVQCVEWLKRAGLSSEEIKLYQDNETDMLDRRQKMESGILKSKLDTIYNKINKYQDAAAGSSKEFEDSPSTSNSNNIFERLHEKPLKYYPEGHPIHELKSMEESLFHFKKDIVIPITKRRKILRHLERRKMRIMSQENQLINNICPVENISKVNRPGSLWDVKEMPSRSTTEDRKTKNEKKIGPRPATKYTIKDNKIVRLEPVERNQRVQDDEYRAVDIVVPVNPAEEQLLEGTKMCLDDIKKIDRFKDYEPGIPSKVLYLKNIAPSVSQDQVSLLFNQFVLDNGGPIEVRLMTGRMRGQAFVEFQKEDLAIQALDEINGTILSGRPIIAQFGRNSNRIQEENR